MPLIFENTNTAPQDYACTFSAHQKAVLRNQLRQLWETGFSVTLATISPSNKGLKYMYIWMVYTHGVYGLFSINGTLQGDKVLPLIIHKLDMKIFEVV